MDETLKKAINDIESFDYVVCTMVHDHSEYEIYDRDWEVIIDHLSEAQVIALANILSKFARRK